MNIRNKNGIAIGFLRGSILLSFIFFLMLALSLTISGCTLLTGNSTTIKDTGNTAAAETSQLTEATEPVETTLETTSESTSEVTAESAGGEFGEVTINVYYANSTAEYLIGETRSVSVENKFVDALNEMMKEPTDSMLVRLIPDTTKINGIVVEEGLCELDLSSNFVDDRFISDAGDILLLYSVVDTLTEFPEINSVELYIDGTKLDTFGQLAISDPLFRRSDLIK